jgi:hypothetical protein
MECIDEDLLSHGYEPLKVIGKGKLPLSPHGYAAETQA